MDPKIVTMTFDLAKEAVKANDLKTKELIQTIMETDGNVIQDPTKGCNENLPRVFLTALISACEIRKALGVLAAVAAGDFPPDSCAQASEYRKMLLDLVNGR